MLVPCLRDEWHWASLSLTAPSGIPGDLPDVFSLTKYRGSAWWAGYFPYTRGIKIECIRYFESMESSVIGDSNRDSKEGCDQGELRRLEAPQGATGQNPCSQRVDGAPDSSEQQLSSCS